MLLAQRQKDATPKPRGFYYNVSIHHLLNYNQQGGEHGSYLGPEPAPNHFSYNPKDVSSDNTRLAMYFYCHPTYEDEYHITLNYCEKHWDKPTYIKGDWQIMYAEAKEEMINRK
jgi:hypothetical protein